MENTNAELIMVSEEKSSEIDSSNASLLLSQKIQRFKRLVHSQSVGPEEQFECTLGSFISESKESPIGSQKF